MMELLIHTNCVTEEILLTRLPVGHTHEDIDAKFAKIWVACRNALLGTPQEYKTKLEEVFSKSDVKCEVVDVFAIPDYKAWLENCIDKRFHSWAKEENTQLQWRFIPAPGGASEWYPMAVIDYYRAYCHANVIEVVKSFAPHDTEIGAEIGLVAQQTEVEWLPTAKPERPEGMFVLTNFPVASLKAAAFVEESRAVLDKTLAGIQNEFRQDSRVMSIISDWQKWDREEAPATNDVYEFIAAKGGLHQPMSEFFRAWGHKRKRVEPFLSTKKENYASDAMKTMIAGECVEWAGQKKVQPPRILKFQEELSVSRIALHQAHSVDYKSRAFTVDALKKFLCSRGLSRSGNRNALEDRLRQDDDKEMGKRYYYFILHRQKKLIPSHQQIYFSIDSTAAAVSR